MDNLTLTYNYKAEERKNRNLASNGLDLLLRSIAGRADMAQNPAYTELWTAQNAKLPPDAQTALAQMEALVVQLHLLMWGLHTAYAQIEPGGNLFPGITEPE